MTDPNPDPTRTPDQPSDDPPPDDDLWQLWASCIGILATAGIVFFGMADDSPVLAYTALAILALMAAGPAHDWWSWWRDRRRTRQ